MDKSKSVGLAAKAWFGRRFQEPLTSEYIQQLSETPKASFLDTSVQKCCLQSAEG